MSRVLEVRAEGIYCPAGDFYVDPWGRVERAVVTHAHSDHARWGHQKYLTSGSGGPLVRARLGDEIDLATLEYGERCVIGGAVVSLHPAGHVLGSCQVRVEVGGEVWVVSGDYKREVDRTAEEFELVRCHGFVTETTFGLPIYRWRTQGEVFGEINGWWARNREAGVASVLFCYSLGKAQRLLSGLGEGLVVAHGSMVGLNAVYRSAGVDLRETRSVTEVGKEELRGAMVLAPSSAGGTPWLRRFGRVSVGYASGWMSVRGARRRRAVDQGFVLSDHVDWPALVETVAATGAEDVWTTHGYAAQVARYFSERGLRGRALETRFVGEAGADVVENEAGENEALGEEGVESA